MAAQKDNNRLDTEYLRSQLKARNQASELALRQKHPEATDFFDQLGLRPGQIRQHAARLLTSGALAGTLLLSAHPATAITAMVGAAPSVAQNSDTLLVTSSLQKELSTSLRDILPPVGQWGLSSDQEKKISKKLKDVFGVTAVPELDGNRLPNDYGRMGAEQHLPRFPGDSVEGHNSFLDKGITPGLGGWGYFARSEDELTPELEDTEKYYVAVQVMYLPDWKSRVQYYVNWFKYRRMLVVNPANGKAVVAAVADAGPAAWTGKHFGGSPEVMAYLGINYGMQNHPVVLFFLDDPSKEIPLGPLEYNVEINKKLTAKQA